MLWYSELIQPEHAGCSSAKSVHLLISWHFDCNVAVTIVETWHFNHVAASFFALQLPAMLSVLTAVGSAECWHKKSTFKASV
jgi:hypothetical protein